MAPAIFKTYKYQKRKIFIESWNYKLFIAVHPTWAHQTNEREQKCWNSYFQHRLLWERSNSMCSFPLYELKIYNFFINKVVTNSWLFIDYDGMLKNNDYQRNFRENFMHKMKKLRFLYITETSRTVLLDQ